VTRTILSLTDNNKVILLVLEKSPSMFVVGFTYHFPCNMYKFLLFFCAFNITVISVTTSLYEAIVRSSTWPHIWAFIFSRRNYRH